MRRLIAVILVTLLGIMPLVIPSLPAAAQENYSDFDLGSEHGDWAAISRPNPLPALPTDGGILQPYEVFFSEDFAAVPEVENAQFMVVRVMEGSFALAPREQGTFIVDPADEKPIQYLEETSSEPFFLPIDSFVRDESGQLCTRVCAIPLKTAVQVNPGDTVVVLADSVCLWCLLNANPAVQDKGLLIVSVLLAQGAKPDDFRWVESWTDAQGDAAQAASDATPVALNWAFNPSTSCSH